jgi:hypothetical protein
VQIIDKDILVGNMLLTRSAQKPRLNDRRLYQKVSKIIARNYIA